MRELLLIRNSVPFLKDALFNRMEGPSLVLLRVIDEFQLVDVHRRQYVVMQTLPRAFPCTIASHDNDKDGAIVELVCHAVRLLDKS